VQLDHEFTVPVPASQAWSVLMDIERIAPCMPGATVTKVEGRDVEGTVKVKVGPITVTYGGTATFLEMDEAARRAVVEARGRETRGSGTASARITTQLHEEDGKTRVTVSTDLSITGKPAQFGRGVMSDVGAKLLGQFADCLSTQFSGVAGGPDSAARTRPESAAAPALSAAGSAGALGADSAPASVLDAGTAGGRPTDDAIDLLGAAGVPVLKRLAPVLAAAALLTLLVAILRRRR
jgi:uncharacterized protein